jgi:hypothetical protein
MSWLEDVGLAQLGFTQDQIQQIEAAQPDALHFIADLQAIWPTIKPYWPAIEKHVTTLLPVARMVLEVVNRKPTA